MGPLALLSVLSSQVVNLHTEFLLMNKRERSGELEL